MAIDRRKSMAGRLARRLALSLLVGLSAPAALAVKDTPLGVELVAANFPNSTATDTVNALLIAAQIGSHTCMTWHWGEPDSLPRILSLMPSIRQFKLKTVIQMATTFLGDPAPGAAYQASFASAATRNHFLANVADIAATKPDYLVLTTEVNLMYRFNRPEFDNFRSLYTQAYSLVKSISPNTKVGVSFLYKLWVGNYFVDHVDLPAQLMPHDFIAFTSYPADLVQDGSFASISDIPALWHGLSRQAYPTETIIFPEVGWSSKGTGTPELQAEFVRNLPRLMSTTRPELVTWALLYDVEFFTRQLLSPDAVAFLTGLGIDIDLLFEHFNAMGLLDGYGNPKPSLNDAAAIDFSKP
jgi:hypothetical protein